MLLTGLTGGIGAGKSTVADAFAARGAVVIDADRVAREVVLPGGPAYAPLVDRFGSGVVAPDGTIDRPALAAVVFADSAARADLNAITHPVIAAEMQRRVLAHEGFDGVVILDIPLLDQEVIARYGLAAVVVVDTPEDVAVARLVAGRGFTEADARARIAAQMSRAQRRALVARAPLGVVIDNRGGRAELEAQIDQAWVLLDRHTRSVP
jgi:dephospho-CoA kinase